MVIGRLLCWSLTRDAVDDRLGAVITGDPPRGGIDCSGRSSDQVAPVRACRLCSVRCEMFIALELTRAL